MAQKPPIETIPFDTGRPLLISATTAGGANALYVITNTDGDIDSAFVFANNGSATATLLHLILNPDDSTTPTAEETLTFSIPPYETVALLSGHRLTKSASGSNTYAIGAYAGTTDVIRLYGWVNRLYQDPVTP